MRKHPVIRRLKFCLSLIPYRSSWGFIPCLAGLVVMMCSSGGAAPAKKPSWAVGRDVFINHCAVCHHVNSGTRAPLPSVLRQMSSQEILEALQTGVMKAQGSHLSAQEKGAVADFLVRRRREAHLKITSGFCAASSPSATSGDPIWNGWGNNDRNTRFQSRSGAGLDRDQVKRLKVKWAFGFPGASTAQPTVFGDRVLVGSADGSVYSLDAGTGCIEWIFKAASGVRASISVSQDGRDAYVADGSANVYAITMEHGALV